MSQPSSSGRKLPPIRRRTVAIDPGKTVRTEFFDERELPLVIRANGEIDLVAWVSANRQHVEDDLLRYGAVLLRDFRVDSIEQFEQCALVFTSDLLNYVEGSSPRTMLADKVYTSTEYPPEYFISLHNELSYAHKWPGKLFFHCVQPAESGGETPIADGRRVLRLLPPELVDRFERKGVRYLRNMHQQLGAGMSWSTVFETTDRAFIEDYCREGDISFEWRPDGGLRTSQVRPGVIRHPRTGERVWFNQADQWHPSNLGDELAIAMGAVTDVDDLPLNAQYGDGSPIAAEDLQRVREAFHEAAVLFPWQTGDVLVIDNTMVSHGRSPFTGSRRVVVTMGDTVRLAEAVHTGTVQAGTVQEEPQR
jgi:alpha-ketoglutarate-dependent taurine dioxygenase